MKYIKKPLIVEAFQFGVDDAPDWFTCHVYMVPVLGELNKLEYNIRTLVGEMKAHKGDMIIKGIKGEIYPCKKDIFDAYYEQLVG